MIEKVFRSYLLASSAVTALVVDRIYSTRAPQNATYPLLVIRKLDSDGSHDMRNLPGHAETRYRLLAASDALTVTELLSLRDALKGLDGFSLAYSVSQGFDVSFNEVGTELQSAAVIYERDDWVEGSQIWQLVMDWELIHTETFAAGITV